MTSCVQWVYSDISQGAHDQTSGSCMKMESAVDQTIFFPAVCNKTVWN